MMNSEMIKKLRGAKTKEEILSIAKEYGGELTAEQAEEMLKRLNSADGALSDDELEAAAGGREWRIVYANKPKEFF